MVQNLIYRYVEKMNIHKSQWFGIKMHGNTRVLTCWPYPRYVKMAVEVGINWRLGKNGDKIHGISWLSFWIFFTSPGSYGPFAYWKWWKNPQLASPDSRTIRVTWVAPPVPPMISMDIVGDFSLTSLDWGYPLVNIQKTMENHHFSWENSL